MRDENKTKKQLIAELASLRALVRDPIHLCRDGLLDLVELATQVTKLRELNQLKDDFLSTVSHELRAPLTNMKIALQMLKLADCEEDYERYLDLLNRECSREIYLINDLLDLQRLETGNKPPAFQMIFLQEWLPGVLRPFQLRAEKQQQSLEVALKLQYITTDSYYLSRIVTELVNNACKYTPAGGVITVDIQPWQEPSQEPSLVDLSVVNTGAEIPADELPLIFNKFYRVPTPDPWQQGGTGLGLALVKQLVTTLEGKIEVESIDLETRFRVRLPQKICA